MLRFSKNNSPDREAMARRELFDIVPEQRLETPLCLRMITVRWRRLPLLYVRVVTTKVFFHPLAAMVVFIGRCAAERAKLKDMPFAEFFRGRISVGNQR